MYESVKCSKCGDVGYGVIKDSDVKKLVANIICLYCYNNLPIEQRLEEEQ